MGVTIPSVKSHAGSLDELAQRVDFVLRTLFGSSAAGGNKQWIAPFGAINLAELVEEDFDLYWAADDTGSAWDFAQVWVAPAAGSIIGLQLSISAAISAGSASLQPRKNGVGTGFSLTLDSSNDPTVVVSQAAGADTFVAGDEITLRYTCTDTLNTTPTYDLFAQFQVQFD